MSKIKAEPKKVRWCMFLNDEDKNTPVCYLQLGARASNALMRSGIRTIGEVVDKWENKSEHTEAASGRDDDLAE